MIRRPPRSPLFPYTTPSDLFGASSATARPQPQRVAGFGQLLHAHPLRRTGDRKSTRLNSSHTVISYAVFCLKKKMIKFVNLPSPHPQPVSLGDRVSRHPAER